MIGAMSYRRLEKVITRVRSDIGPVDGLEDLIGSIFEAVSEDQAQQILDFLEERYEATDS